MTDHSILIISGTNRPISNTLRIARIVERHYQQAGVHATLFSLADLPLEIYSSDAYAKKPAAFVEVQKQIRAVGGGIAPRACRNTTAHSPGVLAKHSRIDMLKFPESFERKPVAFVGLAKRTVGRLAGSGTNADGGGISPCPCLPRAAFSSRKSISNSITDGNLIDASP